MAAFLAVRAAGVGRQPRYYWAGRDRPLPGTVGRAAGDRWSWGVARQGDLRFSNGPRCGGHWPGWDGNHGITGPVATGPCQGQSVAGPRDRGCGLVGCGPLPDRATYGSRTAPAA